jgi:hypothetical protein
MTTQRRRMTNRLAVGKIPAGQFPIQREIHQLEEELNAFNERIAELEAERHRSHALEVLKANAIDFARRIDELRCVLIESAPKASAHRQSSSKS